MVGVDDSLGANDGAEMALRGRWSFEASCLDEDFGGEQSPYVGRDGDDVNGPRSGRKDDVRCDDNGRAGEAGFAAGGDAEVDPDDVTCVHLR